MGAGGELQLTSSRLVETIAERQPDASPNVIATLTAGTTLYELTRHLELGGWLSQSFQIVLGLPSNALKGGRPHLVQLGGIRRFAEEWDLSVALDLSGQFDPRGRLRRRSPASANGSPFCESTPRRHAAKRDRVACRALHAAMDRDHILDVAVAPVKAVPFPITPRVASSGARRAVDYVAERAVLHARALREESATSIRRSSRGI